MSFTITYSQYWPQCKLTVKCMEYSKKKSTANDWQTLLHKVVSITSQHLEKSKSHNFSRIARSTDCLRWYHTLQGDNSLKSVERFDHMMFVCRFQASRWSKPQREKLLCGYWIYSSESVDWNLLKFWYLL